MSTQLEAYVKNNGSLIEIGNRTFEFAGLTGDGDISVASFKTRKASYTGILCSNTTVAGHPGAEVWSIISKAREVAHFAIHQGRILPLSLRIC